MVTKMKAEKLAAVSGRDTIRNRIEEQRGNMNYMRNHYEGLLKKYPNHWVIIRGGRVISAVSSADRLIESISKAKKGNDLLYYLASPKKRMLL